jgi:hypothetical protein
VAAVRRVTLIEVLLVIALVGVAAGFIGMRTLQSLKNQRFESSVDNLVARLSLTQQLMVGWETDLWVDIGPDDEGHYQAMVTCDETPPVGMERFFSEPLALPGVDRIEYQGKEIARLPFTAWRRDQLCCGTLTLYSERGKRASIALPGYPARITKGTHEESPYEAPPYPQALLPAR